MNRIKKEWNFNDYKDLNIDINKRKEKNEDFKIIHQAQNNLKRQQKNIHRNKKKKVRKLIQKVNKIGM